MAGLFGGLSNFLFGQAPGATFDPQQYLNQMSQMDAQIQALFDNAPKSNVVGSQQFAQIQSLLAPGANGGLSSPLQAQYNSGSLLNALNASQAGALSQSHAQQNNLAGSSIAQQGLENASMQQTLANSGLLASLYGNQNQNMGMLAQLLSQGSEFDVGQNNAMIQAHAGALGGIAHQDMSMAGTGMNQNYQSSLADFQNQGQLGVGLLKMAPFLGSLLGGMGGAGGGGGGMAGMPGLNLAGSGYSMPGFGGMAGMGGGGYRP